MIADKKKLKDMIISIAAQEKFLPLMVEKDYYLTNICAHLQDHLSGQLVLKGSMSLNKVYFGNYRLCGDLDFYQYSEDGCGSRMQRSKNSPLLRQRIKTSLEDLGFNSDNVQSVELLDPRVLTFNIRYHSCLTEVFQTIKIDISLLNELQDKPTVWPLKHFYHDFLSTEGVTTFIPVLTASLNEIVAGKLVAAISSTELNILDYYDLWYLAGKGFDFSSDVIAESVMKKLVHWNFYRRLICKRGLGQVEIDFLNKQKKEFLKPFLRHGDEFDLDREYKKINQIFLTGKFDMGFKFRALAKISAVLTKIKDRIEG